MLDERQIAFGVIFILLGIGLLAGSLTFLMRRRAGRRGEDTKGRDAGRKFTEALTAFERTGSTVFGLVLLALLVWSIWTAPPRPVPTSAELERMTEGQRKRELAYQNKQYLCLLAAACKKYDDVRLECATAGSFKTCLRVKMGSDADFSGMCSGSVEGGPALPRPPETPNIVECFFLPATKP
jgi:hypothetical protein